MTRVAKYLRKLVKEKKADPTLMSKEEFFAKLDKAEESIEQGKGKTFTHPSEMNAWLNSFFLPFLNFDAAKVGIFL